MLPLTMVIALLSASSEPDVALEVPVRGGTTIDAEILDAALRETAEIFAPGNIVLRFRLEATPTGRAAPVSVVIAPKPSRFVVQGCRRGRHDHRLGHSQLGTRKITLWSEQVARAVHGNWDRSDVPEVDRATFARALGRVLAHELGHLLLRLDQHRDGGLMRSSFSHRSLIARGRRAFRLSSADLVAIRDAIERQSRDARAPPPKRQRPIELTDEIGGPALQARSAARR